MRSRTIAIAGSIAALAFAATPVAAIAATGAHHTTATESKLDRSRDASGVRHGDRTSDRNSADTSRDVRDR